MPSDTGPKPATRVPGGLHGERNAPLLEDGTHSDRGYRALGRRRSCAACIRTSAPPWHVPRLCCSPPPSEVRQKVEGLAPGCIRNNSPRQHTKNVWSAPSASDLLRPDLISLRQRIRSPGHGPGQVGDPRIPVLINFTASSAPFFVPGFQNADRLSGHLVSTTRRPRQPPAVARQPGWPVVLPHPKMLPRRRELSQPNAPWFLSPFAGAKPSQVTADAHPNVPVGVVADPPSGAGKRVKLLPSLTPWRTAFCVTCAPGEAGAVQPVEDRSR